jgi:hypothetical protein
MHSNINNSYELFRLFKDHGRENQFSFDGIRTLYNYFNELEESTDEEIKIDIIAICCEFTEYSKSELLTLYDYKADRKEFESEEEYIEAIIQELQENTVLLLVEHYNTDNAVDRMNPMIENTYILQNY